MSRKRFIKLMMAQGWSRNAAAALAGHVDSYGSYEDLYHSFNRMTYTLSTVAEAMKTVMAGVAAFCDAVAEASSNLAKRLNEVFI